MCPGETIRGRSRGEDKGYGGIRETRGVGSVEEGLEVCAWGVGGEE